MHEYIFLFIVKLRFHWSQKKYTPSNLQWTESVGDSVVKNTPANAGHPGLMPGLGRSPREGNGYPLQYSCLENPMDRGCQKSDTTEQLTHTHRGY